MKQVIKEKTIIATREFTRNFAQISKQPISQKYIVINHGKIVGTFIPQPNNSTDWWKGLENQAPEEETKKSLTLSELREKYSFHSGEKHLSQRIDEIVYGVKR